jgi:hypothetical protein
MNESPRKRLTGRTKVKVPTLTSKSTTLGWGTPGVRAVAYAIILLALQMAGSLAAQQAPPQPQPASIEYKNARYGFCFYLPESWKGYFILTDRWRGYHNSGGPHGDETVAAGPRISIRHPQWTAVDPRQDIPIMVFTIAQWRALQKDKFFVSAAPIGPGELGRNRNYVFGLPARFDWAFPTGYEEVEQILSGKPLHTECKAQ